MTDEEHDLTWLRECVTDHDSTSIDGGCPVSIAEHCLDIADRYEAAVQAAADAAVLKRIHEAECKALEQAEARLRKAERLADEVEDAMNDSYEPLIAGQLSDALAAFRTTEDAK